MSLVVFTLLNLVRYIRGGLTGQGWNGVVTIVAGWVIGSVAAWLFGESDIGAGITVPGFSMPLGDLRFADVILVGLVIASGAGAFNEATGAVDRSRSTAKPKLVQEPPPEMG